MEQSIRQNIHREHVDEKRTIANKLLTNDLFRQASFGVCMCAVYAFGSAFDI